MKFKLTVGLALILVAALLVGGLGCNKTTGGGWFYNLCDDSKITFGFTAQPTEPMF